MQKITFTIVVACLNEQDRIAATIQSVLDQTFSDYEIIVKDGLSQDGTLQKIPDDPRIRVFREQDCSVYDGMNQGLSKACGDFVMFLNCGDALYDSAVLENTARHIRLLGLDGHSVVYGDVFKDDRVLSQNRPITRKNLLREGLCHQSIFMGRSLLNALGGFDTSLKLCADYDAIVHAYIIGARYAYLDTIVCRYAGGGISERDDAISQVRQEGKRIRQRYFSPTEQLGLLLSKAARKIKRAFPRRKAKEEGNVSV